MVTKWISLGLNTLTLILVTEQARLANSMPAIAVLCEYTIDQQCNITINNDVQHISMFILSSDEAASVTCVQCDIGAMHMLRDLAFVNSTEGVDLSYSHITSFGYKSVSGKNLKYLNLAGNDISELEMNTFAAAPQLKELNLCENKINQMHFRTFYGVDVLEKLWLCYNNITHLHERTFSRIPKLKTLSLHHNAITMLPEKIFDKNTYLSVLTLHNNLIESVEDVTINQLRNIKSFDMTNLRNQISINTKPFISNKSDCFIGGEITNLIQYPDGLMENQSCRLLNYVPTHYLEGRLFHFLNLRNNRIKSLNEPLPFGRNPHLSIIDLSHNRIAEIHFDVFNETGNLKIIWMSDNAIDHLDIRTFAHLSELQVLHLHNNQIQRIESAIFFNNLRLTELTLNNNSIEYVGAGAFDNLHKLDMFDMSVNRIKNAISLSVNAKYVNISHTNITTKIVIGERVRELFAINNRINTVSIIAANNLAIVDISNNSMRHIQFGTLKNLKKLNLSNNQLESIDCGSAKKLAHLNLSNNKLKSIRNITRFHQLQSLDLSFNEITDMDDNTFYRMNSLKHLNLKKSGLRRIDQYQFKELIDLEWLDISDNNLGTVDLNYFGYQKKDYLFDLYIGGNNLTHVISDGKVFMMDMSNFFPVLDKLEIGNNPWNCTHLLELVMYLNSRQVTVLTESLLVQTNPIKEFNCDHLLVMNAFYKLFNEMFSKYMN